MTITFTPARASQYSAIQSCGSIWVVQGLYSRDSEVTNVWETGRPVHPRQRRGVGVEVADRTIPLAQNAHCREAALRAPEARHEVGELLAEGSRARRLSVRARRHGGVGVAVRERRKLHRAGLERAEERRARRVQQARVTEVVDVFRGAAEVHQLEGRIRGPDRGQLLTQVVFNSLDVVIDALLDGLDGRRRCRLGCDGKLTRAPRAPRA